MGEKKVSGGNLKVRSRTRRRPRRLGAGGPEEDPQGWTAEKQAPFNRRQRGETVLSGAGRSNRGAPDLPGTGAKLSGWKGTNT